MALINFQKPRGQIFKSQALVPSISPLQAPGFRPTTPPVHGLPSLQ